MTGETDRTVAVGGSISYENIRSKYHSTGLSGLVLAGTDILLKSVLDDILVENTAQSIFDNLVTRMELLNSSEVCDVIKLYENTERVTVSKPVHVQSIPDEIESHLRDFHISDQFICRIPSAKLLGSKAVAKIENGFILDTSMSNSKTLKYNLVKKPTDNFYLRNPLRRNGDRLQHIVPLTDHYRSYHHWVFKSLTRLHGVEEFTKDTDQTYKLLIPADPPPWITESLQFFGYDEEDWIEWNSRTATVKDLLVPSIRAVERTDCDIDIFDYKVLSPSACRWVRTRANEQLSPHKREVYSNKIYISREDVGKRKIKNSGELKQLLDKRGFESYTPGKMSFEDQVALFSQATDIVAPHGAGLTNIMFAKDANVVEIFGTNVTKPTYCLLANVMDHNYGFHIGSQPETGTRDSDILVSINELNELFNKMGM